MVKAVRMDDQRRVNDSPGHGDAPGRANARPGDYRNTLNLPKTAFPMKANLPTREPERLARWAQHDLYRQIRERRRGAPKFILHDGPPYANGAIHIGHALNKTLKDIVVRYKTMRGFDAPFVPGWDCHGLPIEHALLKELGKRKEEVPRAEFRRQARAYAERYIAKQREEFQRLGVFGDWDHPYLTMAYDYQAAIADAFFTLYEQQFIERRLKPVPWCADCETALADAELEYETKSSEAVYVTFPIEPEEVRRRWPALADRPLSVVVWTTTPWTLPANVGLAFHPELTYVVVEAGGGRYLVVKDLVESLRQPLGWGEAARLLDQCLGESLESLKAQHPFLPRQSTGILGAFVSDTEGTGVVHIAPGHGEDDYQVGHLEYGLPIVSPVDAQGRFTKEFEPCAGQSVFAANRPIVELLQRQGRLLGRPEPYQHSYPHCWRCKQPILFRATPQWFLDVDHAELRQRTSEAIERQVQFVPAWGESRIGSMVASRPDWCLSRQRYWGVPIPVIRCTACEKVYVSELRARVLEVFKREGADPWFERPAEQWLASPPRCCAKPSLRKEEDILDVWFDSGASHHAVLVPRQGSDLAFPADLYLEGSDQHRGWFQTSLLVALGIHRRPPFTGVLTHGFVVDGQGRKMSKSLGNVIAPQDVLTTHGADILRLWVAGCDYTEDIRLSPVILEQSAELYRKLRNTIRYLLGNLSDFDPASQTVPLGRLTSVDRWAVSRAARLIREATAAYEAYEFHKVVRLLAQFCTVDLSNFYLDALKDRLYTYATNDPARRSAQTALAACAEALVTLLAPIAPFTADEAWETYGRWRQAPLDRPGLTGQVPSVHLADWPAWGDRHDPALEQSWERFFEVRDVVLKALEQQRVAGLIGDPGEAAVILAIHDAATWEAVQPLEPMLAELLLVSAAQLAYGTGEGIARAEVRRAPGAKCPRCWRYTQDGGRSAEHPALCARCVEVLAVNEQVTS